MHADDADRPNPWRRGSRQTVYENPWMTVWHDEVTRPNGSPGIYGVIHFEALAVGVVALDADGRIVLVGQYRYTLDRWSWEIPEGGVPFDEDPLDGARRELREETGLEASEWRELLRFDLSNSVTDESGVMYLATGLTPGVAAPDPTEEIEVRWVPFDEAVAMTLDGRITDIMSIVAIQHVALERAGAGRAAGEARA